jgi:hypothetical protein
MAFANDCLDTIGTCPDNIPSLCTSQSVEERLTLKLFDPCSRQPLDLTIYDIPEGSSSGSSSPSSNLSSNFSSSSSAGPVVKHGVEIVTKEAPQLIPYWCVMADMPTVEESKAGIVHFTPPAAMVEKPGIFTGMALIWEHGVAKKQWPFWLDVRPRLDIWNIWNPGWPITVPEIRIAIRDTCPEVNFLIDKVEFETHEIIWAIQQPVDKWNATRPPVGTFTYADFPYRYHWRLGAVAELLRMAAIWMRRNDLDYSAGGLQIMDTKKWPDYLRISDTLRDEYDKWMINEKKGLNLDNAYASLGGYKYAPYR